MGILCVVWGFIYNITYGFICAENSFIKQLSPFCPKPHSSSLLSVCHPPCFWSLLDLACWTNRISTVDEHKSYFLNLYIWESVDSQWRLEFICTLQIESIYTLRFPDSNTLLIYAWFLKNQFGKIKFNELDF